MTNAQNLIVLLEDKGGLKVPPVLCTLKYVRNVVTCAFLRQNKLMYSKMVSPPLKHTLVNYVGTVSTVFLEVYTLQRQHHNHAMREPVN